MFRKMRRFGQQLPQAEAESILTGATSGVLALLGDEDYPYAVPMSHVYSDGKLYFHSAPAGHKVDAARRGGKASFCVIASDDLLPEKLTTLYTSVIVFGRIRIVEDDAEKLSAIRLIGSRFAPGHMDKGEAEIQESWNRLTLLALDIEHMTGKESRELMVSRRSHDS